MESLLDNITGFSITGDTGSELDEMDLHAFLGEPDGEGFTWTGGPLKPQVRQCRQPRSNGLVRPDFEYVAFALAPFRAGQTVSGQDAKKVHVCSFSSSRRGGELTSCFTSRLLESIIARITGQ